MPRVNVSNYRRIYKLLSGSFLHFRRNPIVYKAFTMAANFYAVKAGLRPGIYSTWAECEAQVKGFKGAKFKKFKTLAEANDFVGQLGSVGSPNLTNENISTDTNLMVANFLKRKLEFRSPASKVAKTPRKLTAGSVTEDDSDFNWNPPPIKVPNNLTPIEVYTDGACGGNGKNGACGGIGVYWGPSHPMNVSEPLHGRQTNNRAEIMAAVKALCQAREMGRVNVTLCTDSKFMINGITTWIKKWRKNGWKTGNSDSVINKEDFQKLDLARNGLNVTWKHVKGHQGVLGNECADKLAVAGASKTLSVGNPLKRKLDLPSPPTKVGKTPSKMSASSVVYNDLNWTPPPIKVPHDLTPIEVYTDGACTGNGKKRARGGIGVYWGVYHPMNVSEPLRGRQTNNRAEIMAAVKALCQAREMGRVNVTLCTDSQFLINGITLWIRKWRRNGWKTGDSDPVINKEDFQMLDLAKNGLNVTWKKVKGHRGIFGNEYADKLAVIGASVKK